MGDLLHILHADQIRLEEAAETIPGLLVMEFEQPARSGREQRLMADNAEQRAHIEALTERNAGLARELAILKAELATVTGRNATPRQGCHFAEVRAGDALIPVEYSTDPEESRPSESVHAEKVFVNGKWVDWWRVAEALEVDSLIEACAEQMRKDRQAADELFYEAGE